MTANTVTVRPGRISGTVQAPPSKSVVQRAVALAALADGASVIRARSLCDDARAALSMVEALGADVSFEAGKIRVTGPVTGGQGELDCGESGLALRMFSPIAALLGGPWTLAARGTLAGRSVAMLCAPLEALGATCRTSKGMPPVSVSGPLRGGEADVDGSASSQHVSGLLVALPLAQGPSALRVVAPRSVPYLDLTVRLIREFGGMLNDTDAPHRYVIPGGQSYSPVDLCVEGDWSAGAMLLVAGAVAGEIRVTGLRPDSAQADVRILTALERAGATVDTAQEGMCAAAGELRAFSFDATDCPDLFPPLVALAASCEGVSELRGASRLAGKESDRGAALAELGNRLGIGVTVDGDVMTVTGGRAGGGTVHSHGDHRMAMAAALLALRGRAPVVIEDAGCVAKSYPGFFDDLERVSNRLETRNS